MLVIDSGKGEMQSLVSPLGGGSPHSPSVAAPTSPGSSEAAAETTMDSQWMRMASTTGVDAELIATVSRETEIVRHGELEHTQEKKKDHPEACGKRKRCPFNFFSCCSKELRWQCKVCGKAACHGGDCISNHQSQVREDVKKNEWDVGC